MALQTTCIGAYPKPDYVPIRDWFQIARGLTESGGAVTRQANAVIARTDAESEALFARATRAAVEDQVRAGIDIPTDGEQRRENYIHYHCRHLEGIDFGTLTRRSLRDGAYSAELPTISGPIRARQGNFLDRDYRLAQSFTHRPVKITVPGPMTIMDTTVDAWYGDDRRLARDLADALNTEIRALAAAGCRHIQVDEPVFARHAERALDFGVECLERCFHGLPKGVVRVMHMCCGYPDHLDDSDYSKADPQAYFDLAEALDRSAVQQISIEDAHRHNDLALLERFGRSTIILGAVAIADSRLESVEEVTARLRAALGHIDRDRLIAAPDCGLSLLGRDLALAKLDVLCAAAKLV